MNTNRKYCYMFRANALEKAKIIAMVNKAKKGGITQQEFFLKAVLGKNLVIVNTEDYRSVEIELRRIGNNINQIARAVNTGCCNIPINEVVSVREELNNIWLQLKQRAAKGE